MNEGPKYWGGSLVASLLGLLVFALINIRSDSAVFVSGCFVAFLCALFAAVTLNELRKM